MRKLCVLGLGYIGLPTAAMFATHGLQVVGVDVNGHVVEVLNHGGVHIEEPGLKTLVLSALQSGNLQVASRPESADAFIIAVPTPLVHSGEGERPTADLRNVVSAAESVVPHLKDGSLVVLESTVPPRTTAEVLLPILRRSGIEDLLAAHCPERVLPGRILEELVHNDRVIGGIDRVSTEAARELYRSFAEGEIHLTDATTAEMVKLMENTYRDVNIALANEFALVAEQLGIDIWQAIELANRHPRVSILKPGPGVGGHCIAVDPWFVVEAAPEVTPLIQAARRVNDGMPAHVVELVKRAVVGVEKPVIACLGLTYKADVDDLRESPAMKVVQLLQAEGFDVRGCDPHVAGAAQLDGQFMQLPDALRGADCAVILTDHAEFRSLRTEALRVMRRRVVVDTRNAVPSQVVGPQPACITVGKGD